MSKNLDVSTFRNGDEIIEVKSKKEWRKAEREKMPAYCYYEYDAENGKKYGKLYNWYAVNDERGLAPKGYRVPNNADCNTLGESLGGMEKATKKMKTKEGWDDITDDNDKVYKCNGDNSSGFTALPAGACDDNGKFSLIKMGAAWWSSEEASKRHAWSWLIAGHVEAFVKGQGDDDKNNGYSVRCIKD